MLSAGPLAVLLVVASSAILLAQSSYERLFSFRETNQIPVGRLCLAADGGLYGTTAEGGEFSAGSVFVLRRGPGGGWSATTLHSFNGADGAFPRSGVMQARDGNFYGTTEEGGTTENGGSAYGTVFKMTPEGTLTVLHSFGAQDGGFRPVTGLVQGTDDALYGTSPGGVSGFGAAFRITTAGAFTTLHSFTYGEAENPRSALIQGTDGHFYGTAQSAVFRMTAEGTVTVLHAFSCTEYGSPYGGLVQASDGDLYGTVSSCIFVGDTPARAFKISTTGAYTELHEFLPEEAVSPVGELVQGPDGYFYGVSQASGNGGSGPATVFRMSAGGTVTVLHVFSGPHGGAPAAGLTLGNASVLYGLTERGGARNGGTAYEIATTGAFTTIHDFVATPVGLAPWGDLLLADDGQFYGTTYLHSIHSSSAVYRMTPEGDVTLFHGFQSSPEGRNPRAGLIQGTDGDFYGTAAVGGDQNCGCGAVFKLSRSGQVTTLHQFHDSDGSHPTARLVQAADGYFYGTAARGGVGGCGTVFKITAAGDLTTLHTFTGNNCIPYSGLTQASDGNLYGTTLGVGYGLQYFVRGGIYRITPAGEVAFLGGVGGEYIVGGLVQGSDGRLFGTTYGSPPFGRGARTGERVFAMAQDGTVTTLHVFSGPDGREPSATLLETNGFLYGSTARGGKADRGTLFRISKSGQFETLHHFEGTDGAYPVSRLVRGPDGSLYGTTLAGGEADGGVIFRILP